MWFLFAAIAIQIVLNINLDYNQMKEAQKYSFPYIFYIIVIALFFYASKCGVTLRK